MLLKDKSELNKHIVRTMQPVLDAFSDLLGTWMKFIDLSGQYIIAAQPNMSCKACQVIRATPEGLIRCHTYAKKAIKQIKKGGILKSICHAGFLTLTVPIIVEDCCIGALMAGNIIVHPSEEMEERVLDLTRDLKIDRELMQNLLRNLTPWDKQSVDRLAKAIFAISRCFLEIGVAFANNERMELVKSLKEAELRSLQAQINPHFLFNTLNTIEMLAMMEGAQQTNEIVHSLAQILRHNLSSKTKIITLASELESINHYLKIQQYRFGSRLVVQQNIASDLYDLRIPALTLQPLVENAVVHGLEPSEKVGLLEINSKSVNDTVVITISDNGVGMTHDKLRTIRSALRLLDSVDDSLGLINVQKRCRILFGSRFGISISSQLGKGTTVKLRLPRSYKGGYENEVAHCG